MRKSIGRWTGIAAGLVALAVASPAQAQDGSARPGHDPEKRIERLTEALDLTDAQIAEIQAIFAEQVERRQELKASGDREAMRAHMRQTHERMASVLTEEQREKLGTLREHRGEKHGKHDGDHPRHPRDGAEG
ncbi:MAG TPA: hypothetical protein VMR66_04650 [Gemmatimonadota bacterium]|nr:hypothetical protein [Gemmatimonadota bacterium]